jgi:putative redox protein
MAKAALLAAGSAHRKGEHAMALNVTIHSMAGERYAQVIDTGQHMLAADRPKKFGGADSGPGPYSFLLAALGT